MNGISSSVELCVCDLHSGMEDLRFTSKPSGFDVSQVVVDLDGVIDLWGSDIAQGGGLKTHESNPIIMLRQ